jgi:hypothetical protein
MNALRSDGTGFGRGDGDWVGSHVLGNVEAKGGGGGHTTPKGQLIRDRGENIS